MTTAREALYKINEFGVMGKDKEVKFASVSPFDAADFIAENYPLLRKALRVLDYLESGDLVKKGVSYHRGGFYVSDADKGWNACLEHMKQIAEGKENDET